MQYKFDKINEVYPKRTYRSKRTLKKMHLNEFAETLVSIDLSASVFDAPNESKLIDAMYEFDDNIFVFGADTGTNIMFSLPTQEFSLEVIKKYCEDLLLILSYIDPTFAEIESIAVVYGDAYYGEW